MGHNTEEGKYCCLDHNLLSTSTWPMTDMAFPFLSPLQSVQDAALYFLRADVEFE